MKRKREKSNFRLVQFKWIFLVDTGQGIESPERMKYLRVIANESMRLSELSQNTLQLSRPVSFVNRKKRQWNERKTHKFFHCKCGTTLRVPKGKGKIEITCPKCRRAW